MPPSRPVVAFAWLALALLPPCAAAAGPADHIRRGRDLLAQYQCGACHAIPGVPGSRGEVAQPLTAWGKRSYIAGRLVNRPDLLVQWIVAPQAMVPGTTMPSMGVSREDAQAMAAYLFSLD
jgi:mono/diheme cytochrome c family protein